MYYATSSTTCDCFPRDHTCNCDHLTANATVILRTPDPIQEDLFPIANKPLKGLPSPVIPTFTRRMVVVRPEFHARSNPSRASR